MDADTQKALPKFVNAVFRSIRQDAMFWLSIVLGIFCLTVPQIWTVLTQSVESPGLITLWEMKEMPNLLKASAEAAGFTLYLSFLATFSVCAILFVVPPSFLAETKNSALPIHLERFSPKARWIFFALWLLLLLTSISVDLRQQFPDLLEFIIALPQIILVGATVVLFFPPVSNLTRHASGWLGRLVSKRSRAACRFFGILLCVAGVGLILGAKYFQWVARLYPVSIGGFMLLGSLLILAGCWLICVPPDPIVLGPVRTAQSRLISWLFLGWVVGETMWVLAFAPEVNRYISLRLYTMWAALTLPAFLVICASLVDTWEAETQAPVRLLALGAAFLFFLITAAPIAIRPTPPSKAQEIAGDEWPKLFLKRVQAIPSGEPVLFVAASGGGSRAAIFADLVLEFLLREPTAPRESPWADHIVLISGVSGGSLGSATFVQRLDKLTAPLQPNAADDPAVRREDLRNSVKPELVKRMVRQAGILKALIATKAEKDKYSEPAEKMLKECQDLSNNQLGAKSPLDWIIHSALMDDLTADFMAPVFRGSMAPGISRGQALRHYWTDQFGWGPSADRYGFGSATEPSKYVLGRWPLIVFNAADVRRGSRLGVGFPPLPAKMFVEPKSTEPDQGDPVEIRNGPETLADLNDTIGIKLADAVGMSANFPFGFNANTIERRIKTELRDRDQVVDYLRQHDDLTAKILDGGVTDNSGIDTLYLIVKAIQTRARAAEAAEQKDDPWRQLDEELRKRRVHLVIIDSGAKPDKPGLGTKWLSILFDPLAGLNNAAYTNASLATQDYLKELKAAFRAPVDLSCELAELRADPSTDASVIKRLVDLQGVERFSSTRMDANHFLGDNVLTAWSLAPEDKAVLLARFLMELYVARPEFKALGALPVATADDEVEEARKLARDLLDQRRLKSRLTRVQTDLNDIKRVQGSGSKTELIQKLDALDDNLKGSVQLPVVGSKADSDVLQKRVQEVTKASESVRASLNKGQTPSKADLDKLQVAPGGPIGKITADLEQYKATTEKSLQKLNSQRTLQNAFDRRAKESKALFQLPAGGKK